MAVHVAFCNATQVGGSSIVESKPTASENLTTGQTTITAKQGQMARITGHTADSYVVAGQNETASATNGYRVPVGAIIDIGPLNEGDEIAAVNA